MIVGEYLAIAGIIFLLNLLPAVRTRADPERQLFIAAGVMDIPLLPLTAAFFAGRVSPTRST